MDFANQKGSIHPWLQDITSSRVPGHDVFVMMTAADLSYCKLTSKPKIAVLS